VAVKNADILNVGAFFAVMNT
jgi:hypothetical protein